MKCCVGQSEKPDAGRESNPHICPEAPILPLNVPASKVSIQTTREALNNAVGFFD